MHVTSHNSHDVASPHLLRNATEASRLDTSDILSSMTETPNSQIAQYPRSFNVAVSPDQASRHETKCKVEYFEYQAFGQPLQNLGTIGDIYVDLTKGSHMLYAKVEDGWKRWPGPGQRNSSPRHPTYGTYMLWCRVEKNSLGWISQNLITRILSE